MSDTYPQPPLQPGDQGQRVGGSAEQFPPTAGTPAAQPPYPQHPPMAGAPPSQPYYPPMAGAPPSQPYYPPPSQQAPFAGAPPSQPFYAQQPPGAFNGFAGNFRGATSGYVSTNVVDYWKNARSGKRNIGILAAILVLLFACSAVASAASSTASTNTGSTALSSSQGNPGSNGSQNNQGTGTSPQPTHAPTPTPVPTKKPTPVPTESPAQYKASCTPVTVADIAKDPNSYKGKNVVFTAVIANFVQDSNGNTAGANVVDPNDYSSVIQIAFTPHFSVKDVNKSDTIQVWGVGLGAFTGQNAYGGTITEGGVQELYLHDSTSGYNDNSIKDPAAAAAAARASS